MQVVQFVTEVENEGLKSLLGKPVEIWCGAYIYAGDLTGVNDTCIKLSNPHIVYETGPYPDKKYKRAESTMKPHHYIQIAAIESFSEGNRL